MTLFGLFFTSTSGWLYYFGTRPIVFDKLSGHFFKGKNDPAVEANKNTVKVWSPLDQIHALQLLSKYCLSDNSYYSYELNLVLKDGRRINVVKHGNLVQLLIDTKILSVFLDKPIWNAIERPF